MNGNMTRMTVDNDFLMWKIVRKLWKINFFREDGHEV